VLLLLSMKTMLFDLDRRPHLGCCTSTTTSDLDR
jgi:hypothetical protein